MLFSAPSDERMLPFLPKAYLLPKKIACFVTGSYAGGCCSLPAQIHLLICAIPSVGSLSFLCILNYTFGLGINQAARYKVGALLAIVVILMFS